MQRRGTRCSALAALVGSLPLLELVAIATVGVAEAASSDSCFATVVATTDVRQHRCLPSLERDGQFTFFLFPLCCLIEYVRHFTCLIHS